MTLNSFIPSTTIHSEAFQWIHHEDKEEMFVRLERRLVPNVDFDDALQLLGFYSDDY
jgi:hypothetical protein